jgi:flagellum-specific ATP synthase
MNRCGATIVIGYDYAGRFTMLTTLDAIDRLSPIRFSGTVETVKGLVVTCKGLSSIMKVGDRCLIERRQHAGSAAEHIKAEVVGFDSQYVLLMPFDQLEGVGAGSRVIVENTTPTVSPSHAWLGRIVNAFGEPIDGKGALPAGGAPFLIRAAPPPAQQRERVKGKLDLGVRALNTFLTCCRGQRLGIFAGSGVGKSILMSMLARYSTANVNVIGLIGERGREVQEFIEDDLGEEGLKRSVVVVATSSESALMRREAAYMTMAIAEYFRAANEEVLCLMDSVTRFAMAQREIGLSIGEPPATKGYTPTVFAELPRLLERAGPGLKGQGSITGFFTVLVEGDDTNEPVSDTVRGILDGHIIMDRSIAERNRYPAINILRSVSRTMPDCNSNAENTLVNMARGLLSTYDDMAEMIRLGAYRRGSDADVDRAIQYFQPIEQFLSQERQEKMSLEDGYAKLAQILGVQPWPVPVRG